MIDAVLWDNDGVLVDTETIFFETTRQIFAAAGFELSSEHWAISYLGRGGRSRDVALELGIPSHRVEALLEDRNTAYRQRLEGEIPVRDGVRDTLEQLRDRVQLAVVTGSPRDQLLLMHRRTGLLDYFGLIIADGDYERAKPHPDAYLTALAHLGMAADRCLAVEDTPRGVAAAVAAGIRCVVVPHDLTHLPGCSGAFRVVSDVRDIVALSFTAGLPQPALLQSLR